MLVDFDHAYDDRINVANSRSQRMLKPRRVGLQPGSLAPRNGLNDMAHAGGTSDLTIIQELERRLPCIRWFRIWPVSIGNIQLSMYHERCLRANA